MSDGLRRLTGAPSGPEAEMVAAFLQSHDIHCVIRRPTGADVPGFLSGGPREILVRERDEEEARALVESHFGLR